MTKNKFFLILISFAFGTAQAVGPGGIPVPLPEPSDVPGISIPEETPIERENQKPTFLTKFKALFTKTQKRLAPYMTPYSGAIVGVVAGLAISGLIAWKFFINKEYKHPYYVVRPFTVTTADGRKITISRIKVAQQKGMTCGHHSVLYSMSMGAAFNSANHAEMQAALLRLQDQASTEQAIRGMQAVLNKEGILRDQIEAEQFANYPAAYRELHENQSFYEALGLQQCPQEEQQRIATWHQSFEALSDEQKKQIQDRCKQLNQKTYTLDDIRKMGQLDREEILSKIKHGLATVNADGTRVSLPSSYPGEDQETTLKRLEFLGADADDFLSYDDIQKLVAYQQETGDFSAHDTVHVISSFEKDKKGRYKALDKDTIKDLEELKQPGIHRVVLRKQNPHWISVVINRTEKSVDYVIADSWSNKTKYDDPQIITLIEEIETEEVANLVKEKLGVSK